MATIYSLVCWGGSAGKTATMTIASPCVVTITNHGLRDGTGIVFSTTGVLPTGITAGTTYYTRQVTNANSFHLYDTQANAENTASTTGRVNTSGTQSGTHTAKSAYYLGLSDTSRWGSRIYAGIWAWKDARGPVCSQYDIEVCELGEAFAELTDKQWNSAGSAVSGDTQALASAKNIIISKTGGEVDATGEYVGGTRTGAWHDGVEPTGIYLPANKGYIIYPIGFVTGSPALNLRRYRDTVDGFSIWSDTSGGLWWGIYVGKGSQRINAMMVSYNGNSGTTSIEVNAPNGVISNNFCRTSGAGAIGCVFANSDGTLVIGNLFTGGTYGIYSGGSSAKGFFYNNIAIGNTNDWYGDTSSVEGASNNGGDAGEAWMIGTGAVRYTVATTDFVNYSGRNFRPAAITSPQVEQGAAPYGAPLTDLEDNVRPSYSGSSYGTAVTAGSFVTGLSYTIASAGTTNFTLIGAADSNVGTTFKATGAGTGTGTATLNAKMDIGPFEYDLGYGAWPVTRNLNFTGLQSGSQVIIYTSGTTTELSRTNSTGTTLTYNAGASGVTVDYTILKAGYLPIRVTGVALTAEDTDIQVTQLLDRAYVTPSGLTFGTIIGVGGCNFVAPVTNRVVTSLRVAASTTVQNWYSAFMDAFIASSTNTTLKNVAFPVIPFGEASFTLINGIEFSDGATSIAFFKRDGLRYSSDAGVTATAIWAAILTLNTGAGIQVKYRQSPSGSIVNAANTGPMDQLVQVYGDASHGAFDYRGHMVLRAPKPGYSQPKPDLVATYGNMLDGLFVAALEPVLQYATTDADIDAANLALDNTAKTFTITAAHTMAELYQRAQWWANQDAQWDADIPLTTTDGGTFTQPSNWSMIGVAYLTGGTLAGGSATLAAGTQGIAYSGVTLNLGAAGTYTFTAATCILKMTPTAPSTYALSGGSFTGTQDLRNTTAHAITVELPTGAAYTTANNTGGTITVTFPVNVADVSITGMPTATGASTRLQIIHKSALTAAARMNSTAYSLGALRKRASGIGTENTAGLYFRCTTAGTSGGSEPTWNTTPGGTTTDGTAVWTTYKVLFYDGDPVTASYTTTYTDGNEFASGESVEIRFAEMDAGTSFKRFHTTTIAASSGFAVTVDAEADDTYAANAINGSSYETTFSPNFTSNYIVLDTNADFSGKSAYAYFCYTLTSSNGMYQFWDGVTAIDTGNYRIETDILNLYFDESAGFVKQTDDVRIFRKDGLRPALDPTTGGYGIEINWRTPVSVVSTGTSALTPTESAKLMGLPSASTIATAVETTLADDFAGISSGSGLTLSQFLALK